MLNEQHNVANGIMSAISNSLQYYIIRKEIGSGLYVGKGKCVWYGSFPFSYGYIGYGNSQVSGSGYFPRLVQYAWNNINKI